MPRRRRTPGVTSSVVTQRSIDRTICVPGYSGSVRPSSSYTTELKVQQVGSGYGFRGIRSPSFYEEDHLISLELGGSPTASGNLWPEPYSRGARLKDTLENTLHELVCSHRLALRTAQADIAVNWYEAYVEFVGTPRRPAGAGWSSGTATSPTARGCEPGYSPCLPVTNDLNCSDISGPVRVTGSDPYHLDADGDGWGCE